MEIRVKKNELLIGTQRVQGAITDKTQAVMSLKASSDNTLLLNASDRVLATYCQVTCTVVEKGVCFVPARFFVGLVKELPQGEVLLKREGNYLHIIAGTKNSFLMKIPLLEEMVWQSAPTIDTKQNEAKISAVKLSYMIDQVQFCLIQESPRSYGAVAFLHKTSQETLRLVGTDGFRLSYCDVQVDSHKDFLPDGICISKRALMELLKMCHEGFEFVKLAISKDGTTLQASVEGYTLFILLSAIKYPDYKVVLTSKRPTKVEISRTLLQGVSKRVLLAAGKNKILQLCFKDQDLTLRARNLEQSECQERVSLNHYQGSDCQLSINGKFLTDLFTTNPSELISLCFKNGDDPISIVPLTEPTGCISQHVLVPIREND